jgi:hypothetical protein
MSHDGSDVATDWEEGGVSGLKLGEFSLNFDFFLFELKIPYIGCNPASRL